MPKDNFTPEEQLLRIIESGPEKVGLGSPGIKPDLPKNMFKAHGFDKNALKNIRLADVKKIVIVLCAVITVVLVIDFIRSSSGFSKRLDSIIIGKKEAAREETAEVIPAPGTAETAAIQHERNLFSFSPPKNRTAEGDQEGLPSISHLKLVGIIWSDTPQAMIEDTKERRTNLLNTGDQIGEFKLKKITKDSVILDSGGTEQQLR